MLDRARLPDPIAYYESQGLRLVGKGKWRTTSCPFHGGSDSLRVNVESGGFCCMSGCPGKGGDVISFHRALHNVGFVEACKQLGCWVDDPRDPAHMRRRPLPFPPRDGLEVLAQDAMLIAVCGLRCHHAGELTEADRAALLDAACRVHAIALEVLRS